ncbi:hypothetical protein ZWY2020_018110 [Hordeum vulgare]|nr:hypothetical protein ZWY2020_018110 [Hordeum vulgare]
MAEQCKISAAMVAGSEERSYARSYVLKVDGYSRAKALLKNGECVTSAPFSVGGRDWALEFYPNGYPQNCPDFMSVYLFHEPADADVKAKYTISVLDKNGEPVPSYSCTSGSDPVTFSCEIFYYGSSDFIRRADLERSVHLRDDCLTIRCVLAARSSVFKAELLGSIEETSAASPIEIRDMEPDVFNSLLHFIYTDSVPLVLDVVLAGHLLVAADRYNIGRLKLICEEKLCSNIDSDMVATSLALAEQHGFHALKKACFQFLASPSNLEAMMASDGYEHLKSSCPSVFKELIAGILPAELKAAKDITMTMWK